MSVFTEATLLHPEGESVGDEFRYDFLSSGGRFHLEDSSEYLTSYGGLVAWDHFLNRTKVMEILSSDYPLERSSPNATAVKDVLQAFALNCLVGGKRFAHIRRLHDDRVVAKIFGMQKGRLCGEDAFRRLCCELSPNQVRSWFHRAENQLYGALPEEFIADWDSTVNTRYGQQEDVQVGYNSHKPGRGSHHPLVCVVAGTRLALHMHWRKGNTVSATEWIDAMETVWSNPLAQHRLKLNRGDIGFAHEKIMAWHEASQQRPAYLFKLKLTNNVKRAIRAITWPEWSGSATTCFEQFAETTVKLSGWSCERRIVVTRTLLPVNDNGQNEFWNTADEVFKVYVTNVPIEEADPSQIVACYRKRADSENVFDELKNQWGFAGFCSGKAVVSESAARVLLLTYNLWSMFVRVLKNNDQHTEAITSRYELLMIPGRLIHSGRQRIIKLAISDKVKTLLKAAYERLNAWLNSTAPQLDLMAQNTAPWTALPIPDT